MGINFIFWSGYCIASFDIDNACIHFAILSIGVYGIMIGGWASNNIFLDGRACCLSNGIYEVAMGLSIIALFDDWNVEFREKLQQQSGMHWNVF
jgi:NADH-quinone oxidoreductase subunit H